MTAMNTEMPQQADKALAQAADDGAARRKRKRLLLGLAGVVKLLSLAYFAYDHYFASIFISTDSAYTSAEPAQVTRIVCSSASRQGSGSLPSNS